MAITRRLMAVAMVLSITAYGCSRVRETTSAPAKPEQPAAEKKPTEAPKPPEAPRVDPRAALLDPALANERAPEKFRVKFETTKGDVVAEFVRDWSPAGADRIYNLVKIGYFTDVAFFRVIQDPRPFVVQFGIHGDPKVNEAWRRANIPDDPVRASNQRGYISFATAGPNTRTTQLFINLGDNSGLDRMGFSPVGRVVQGMDVVDSLYAGYGEGPPSGSGPNQELIQRRGNAYLKAEFPMLDSIRRAEIVQ